MDRRAFLQNIVKCQGLWHPQTQNAKRFTGPEGLSDRRTSGPRFVGYQAHANDLDSLRPHTAQSETPLTPVPDRPTNPQALPNFLENRLIPYKF